MESLRTIASYKKNIRIMISYLRGSLKYALQRNVSIWALITSNSFISKRSKINRFARIYNSMVGDYSYIGVNTTLLNTCVGKFCSIGNQCSIGLGEHTIRNISTSPVFTEVNNGTGHSWIKKNTAQVTSHSTYVTVGNDVWIGYRAMILNGVTIGDGAIIGAGAIVTKDIPAYAIAVGVPAKIIRYRFEPNIIEKLLQIKWWEYDSNILKRNLFYFQNENLTLELLNKLERSLKNVDL